MYSEVFFTTDLVEAGFTTEYCQEFFASKVELIPIGEEGIKGNRLIKTIDDLTIYKSVFNAKRYRRTRQQIGQSNYNSYLLCLMLKGTRYHTDEINKTLIVEEGDILFLDYNLPNEGCASSSVYIHIHLPQEKVHAFLKNKKIERSFLLKACWPITKILREYILSIFNVFSDLNLEENSVVLENLLTLLFSDESGEKSPIIYCSENNLSTFILRERVCNYIDLNIENPELNVEYIIKHFKVSRAHLYRAFEEEGGIGTVIRKKRLNLAYAEIANSKSPLTITEIAFKYGFTGSNHFYRAFKNYYNICPSEIKFSDFN
ncbi:helix-turn-helix domain-containing protein [Acinetobacter nosocomialis]|uniref:helix-turn-helix domain-containing protein n=1 Tax=Acinetobacter nosocomialis TaxID=106654 RepID=UPI00124CD0D1|nr:AraC family transcriptional regulator [Acinetobacter nosocomialis]